MLGASPSRPALAGEGTAKERGEGGRAEGTGKDSEEGGRAEGTGKESEEGERAEGTGKESGAGDKAAQLSGASSLPGTGAVSPDLQPLVLQRQLLQQQQQQQQQQALLVGEPEQGKYAVSSAAGQSGNRAPLNFAHFSRAAHLYSRAQLKPFAGGPSGRAMGQPHADCARHKEAQGSQEQAHPPNKEAKGSQEAQGSQEQAHPPTVTGTRPPGESGAQLKAEGDAAGAQLKAEGDTAGCSVLDGTLGLERRVGISSASRGTGARHSGSSVAGRSSRFGKRERQKETECTVSERAPSESEGVHGGGASKAHGAGDSSGGGQRQGHQGRAAKRARAAQVHNLSERRRRDRINEHLRMLQELIPNSNKTDKASMLDEAIEYLKMLQLQLQVMSVRTGMSLPPNLIPKVSLRANLMRGSAAGAPSDLIRGASARASDLPLDVPAHAPLWAPGMSSASPLVKEEALSAGALGSSRVGPTSLRDPMAMPGCPDPGPFSGLPQASAAAGVALADPALVESFSAGALGVREPPGMCAPGDGGSYSGRQQLLMETMHKDLQGLHRQQPHHLRGRQEPKAGMRASLTVCSSKPGLPAGSPAPPSLPPLGALPESDMFLRAPPLGPHTPAPSAGFAGAYTYPCETLQAKGSMGSLGMGEGMEGPPSIGALAAAAVMLEGHRQLNPSLVDPLDVYLARHQRMQQQQLLQRQEEELQQQRQRAAVNYRMHHAILRRQNQTM